MEFNGSILVRRRVDVETDTELQPNQLATLHCWQCSVILGDSLDVCGEMKQLDLIICLKVTHDVAVSEARAVSRGGQMANCIYSPLKCRRCHSALGRIIRAAPPHLTAVRNKFLLYKPNIGCYILKSSSVVTARAVTFATKTCKESMNEFKQQLNALLRRMIRIDNRLTDNSSISSSNSSISSNISNISSSSNSLSSNISSSSNSLSSSSEDIDK